MLAGAISPFGGTNWWGRIARGSGRVPGGLGHLVGTNSWRFGTNGGTNWWDEFLEGWGIWSGQFFGGRIIWWESRRDKVPGQTIILGAFASKTILKIIRPSYWSHLLVPPIGPTK